MSSATDDIIGRAISEVQHGKTRFFMENLLTVATKDNRLVRFKFNRLQDEMERRSTGRDYWLKYRQGGSSLYWLGRGTTNAICRPFHNVACITLSTDQGRTKQRLFRHVTRFVDNLPPDIRPHRGRERADYIEFDELESQIYIGTVGSREFGRSETINHLIITELGSFTPAEAHSNLASAIESVVPNGEITFETTPKLVGSAAHALFVECRLGQKAYEAHFAPWWWAEDYHLPMTSNAALVADRGPLELTPEELLISALFLDDDVSVEDRIRWRRSKIADREADFFSEYPEDELSAWHAATESVFPHDRIRQMMTEVQAPIEVIDGALRIHKKYDALRRYVIGADAAGGVPTGDFSALPVQCVETGEVVAVYQAKIGGNNLIRAGAELSLRYGKAMVGGERDSWTLPFMEALERLGVPMYYHEDGKLGFPNTNTSRLQGVALLRGAISEGDWRTMDEPTIQELASYTRTTDEHKLERYGAPPGLHDDIVTGAQRAQQMRVTVPGGGVLMNRGAEQEETTWSYPTPQFGW